MRQLPNTPLAPSALKGLAAYQSKINVLPDYADRVMAAQKDFKKYNSKRNRTFRAVRETLASLCSGPRRCMYCEDSCATDVEHHRPKDFYPELAFVWENYLYACARCNRPKGTRFAVFSAQTGHRVDHSRSRNAPLTPPEPGEPLLLDPRSENPMDYLLLDLRGTFWFVARGQKHTPAHQRAAYTIEILQLNEEPLPQARRNAYRHYLAHLHHYVGLRNTDNLEDAQRVVETIRGMAHPTIWLEMKRQRERISDLNTLFAEAPESLDW